MCPFRREKSHLQIYGQMIKMTTPGWANKRGLWTIVESTLALRLKHIVPQVPAITVSQ